MDAFFEKVTKSETLSQLTYTSPNEIVKSQKFVDCQKYSNGIIKSTSKSMEP